MIRSGWAVSSLLIVASVGLGGSVALVGCQTLGQAGPDTISCVLALGCILCLSGCRVQGRERELTLSDLDFLERDTTLQEVVDKLGWPDRSVGSGILTYQYDLADGGTVEVPSWGGQLHARVQEKDGA